MPFSFPANLNHLKEMLEFVKKQAKAIGFSDDEIAKIELATEEALVNIIKYAYPAKQKAASFRSVNEAAEMSAFADFPTINDEARGQIEIECSLSKRFGLKIEIYDKGIPFDPCVWEHEHNKESPTNLEIGGLGLLFIFNFMDEVNYRREKDRNVLTMTKYLVSTTQF